MILDLVRRLKWTDALRSCTEIVGLNDNPLDLVEGDFITGAVVELRAADAVVGGDGLGLFDGAAISDERGDSGGTERVAASCGRETGGLGSAFDHPEHVIARQPVNGQFALPIQSAEEWGLLLQQLDTGRLDVRIEVLLRQMMGRHLVALAAFLVQSEPPSLALLVVILDSHLHRGAHAREAVNHQTDDGTITESNDCGYVDGI